MQKEREIPTGIFLNGLLVSFSGLFSTFDILADFVDSLSFPLNDLRNIQRLEIVARPLELGSTWVCSDVLSDNCRCLP